MAAVSRALPRPFREPGSSRAGSNWTAPRLAFKLKKFPADALLAIRGSAVTGTRFDGKVKSCERPCFAKDSDQGVAIVSW